jgi:hypothetical protein
MKSVFNLINDYRDTIFYSVLAVLIANSAFHHNLRAFDRFIDLVWAREWLRYCAWLTSNSGMKIIVKPIASTVMWIALTISEIPDMMVLWGHPTYVVLVASFAFINMTIAWSSNRDVIEYFGFRRAVAIYAKVYWKDMFDWPRKQKPPARRLDKAADAVKRLMQKIADATSPAPCPEAV